MAPDFSYLFLLILAICSTFQSARTQLGIDPSPTSVHPEFSGTGYELIKELNLHPTLDVNIFKANNSDSFSITDSDEIVEKRIMLPVLGDSGASVPELAHHTGYFQIRNTVDARMFYYFFTSRNSKADPVVIWLTGGPGCSSALALFHENGPFRITSNLSLVWNDFGWDKVSNIIYVDQPTGTGFSYSSSEKDIRHDEKGVSDDLYNFLQAFLEAHPDYVNNDLYITGESYGGHYIPAFATRINQGNNNKEGIHINLKGFAIGNGLTEPGIQEKAYTDFALQNHLINISDYERISQMIPECEKAVNECGTNGNETCLNARNICIKIQTGIRSISNICAYDIRTQHCPDFSSVEKFLNMPSVKEALGVPKDTQFISCSDTVYNAMMADIMRNLEVGIPELLEEGIEMLVYAGEYDFIGNWLGNFRWVSAMNWSGKVDFEASEFFQFIVDGNEAGLLKNHGPLTFLKVHDSSHYVPLDQPKASLCMLKMWIDGKLSLPERKGSIAQID